MITLPPEPITTDKQPTAATAAQVVNSRFVITNNQTEYESSQVWVSFNGVFTNTGQNQTIGTETITVFGQEVWASYPLSDLQTVVNDLPFYGSAPVYTFSFNNFNGRVYINYGAAALASPPDPSTPGTSPYLVFELAVTGQSLPAPAPTTSNIDLSYVDGVSAAAATMVRNATSGAPLAATSVNPVTTNNAILNSVIGLVPSGAVVNNSNNQPVRVMSSAAAPAAYHDWNSVIEALTQNSTPLKVRSYTSPANSSMPAHYALGGALFGYSGAPAIHGQAPGFDAQQGYDLTATFKTDLNPKGLKPLTDAGITQGTAGVEMTGTGTVSGQFSIYITNENLNAGTGIYGNNPPYVVTYYTKLFLNSGGKQKEIKVLQAYKTAGIVNDLGGRVVGDLLAGIVFGWSVSTIGIAAQAQASHTNLYGITFGTDTFNELSTGQLMRSINCPSG